MVQFASALKYVHSKGIIHSDLKTENILLKSCGTVTLIDFGCALYERDFHPPALGTQEYRSPEALLQCGWSYPTDIWSAGCIFAELLIGESLFPHGAVEDYHLLCIQTCLEQPIPSSMLTRASSHPNPSNPIWFISHSMGYPQFAPRKLHQHQLHAMRRISALVLDEPRALLLRRMLVWEPARRVTAAGLHQALASQSAPCAAPRPASQPPAALVAELPSTPAPAAPRLERAGSAPPNLPSPQLRISQPPAWFKISPMEELSGGAGGPVAPAAEGELATRSELARGCEPAVAAISANEPAAEGKLAAGCESVAGREPAAAASSADEPDEAQSRSELAAGGKLAGCEVVAVGEAGAGVPERESGARGKGAACGVGSSDCADGKGTGKGGATEKSEGGPGRGAGEGRAEGRQSRGDDEKIPFASAMEAAGVARAGLDGRQSDGRSRGSAAVANQRLGANKAPAVKDSASAVKDSASAVKEPGAGVAGKATTADSRSEAGRGLSLSEAEKRRLICKVLAPPLLCPAARP